MSHLFRVEFRSVIAELLQQTLPDGDPDYIRLKLRSAAEDSPAAVQKHAILRDR